MSLACVSGSSRSSGELVRVNSWFPVIIGYRGGMRCWIRLFWLVAFSSLSPFAIAGDGGFWLDLMTPGGPLPIQIRIVHPDGDATPVAVIRNGGEQIEAPAIKPISRSSPEHGFAFPGYGSFIEWNDASGVGRWVAHRRGGPREVPLRVGSRERRFELPDIAPEIRPGRYSVEFSSSDEPAVGVFEINDDGTAAGTFMTTTGDYRYLAGNAAGDSLRLSTFDGAHAFLFHAEQQPDGTLKGDFWSGNWWHETWRAKLDPGAKLPDPFEQTRATGSAADLESLVFRDLDGKPTPVGRIAPPGTPRVVVVFGSWCPNCHDESRLLTELYEIYAPRGLRVAGLAFEHESDFDAAALRVRAYADDLGVHYPLLIAGLSEKDKAGEVLPILDRVRSFPTTLFIDREGSIRAVHTGFTGPATGSTYDEMRGSFIKIIEAMLEPASPGD